MMNRLECQRSAHNWLWHCFYTTLPQTLLWPSWWSLKRDVLFVYLTIYAKTNCSTNVLLVVFRKLTLHQHYGENFIHFQLDTLWSRSRRWQSLQTTSLFCFFLAFWLESSVSSWDWFNFTAASVTLWLPSDTDVNTSELSNSMSHRGPCFINDLGPSSAQPCWVSTLCQWDLVWMSDQNTQCCDTIYQHSWTLDQSKCLVGSNPCLNHIRLVPKKQTICFNQTVWWHWISADTVCFGTAKLNIK